jgi:hypothetical protein
VSQRSALDAALLAKDKDLQSAKSADLASVGSGSLDKNPTRSGSLKSQEKRCSGKPSSQVRKGELGERILWDRLSATEKLQQDPSDPNYDSDNEAKVAFRTAILPDEQAVPLKGYKEAAVSALKEFLACGDVAEAARTLKELDEPDFTHLFVKWAVTLGLDEHDRQRELISNLLSSLYADVITPQQVQRGFLALALNLEDTLLDVPDAVEVLSLFTARAIVDDILPPKFVDQLTQVDSSPVADLQQRCKLALSGRHAAERLLRCWGAHAGLGVLEIRASLVSMLQEFGNSHDVAELERCLRALAVPHYHHEFVRQALLLVVEAPRQQAAVLDMLDRLSAEGLISTDQMLKGYNRVADGLDDLCLDNPSACSVFDAVADASIASGLVEPTFRVGGGDAPAATR